MSAQTLKGPLTAFTPPSSCFNQLWYNSLSDKVQGNPYDENCKPSGWNTAVQYSPALCPLSYSSASGTVVTAGTVTETVIDCCPSSYFADPGTFHCLSTSDTSATAILFTFSSKNSVYEDIVNSPSGGINAHSIQVRYQASDLSALLGATTPASTTSTATTTSRNLASASSLTSISSPTPTSTSTSNASSTTNSTSPSNASSGLSTGAKAGIAIGIICAALFVLALVWVVLRRRKSRQAGGKHPPQYEDYPEHPAEKRANQVPPQSEPAVPLSELPATKTPSRVELSGSQRY